MLDLLGCEIIYGGYSYVAYMATVLVVTIYVSMPCCMVAGVVCLCVYACVWCRTCVSCVMYLWSIVLVFLSGSAVCLSYAVAGGSVLACGLPWCLYLVTYVLTL